MTVILKGRKVVAGRAEGDALVTREYISERDFDPQTGKITNIHHELFQQSFRSRILVFPGAKGTGEWASKLRSARLHGSAPLAVLFNVMTTKVALALVVAGVPAVTDLSQDPIAIISTGDRVKVDANEGIVEILRCSVGMTQ
jgi:hypothetical protein